jgi:hypothetical protein
MTRAQIISAIGSDNIGEWISLGDSFRYILFASDKNSFNDDSAVQYYFSPTFDYVLLRYLNGKPVLTTEAAEIPSGYTKVVHDGKFYLLGIESAGKIDQSEDEAGVFHGLHAFNSIVGFFKK